VLHKLGGHVDEVHALSWSIDLSFAPSSSSSWTTPSSPSSLANASSAPSIDESKQNIESEEGGVVAETGPYFKLN
jgi:hypothetical protein